MSVNEIIFELSKMAGIVEKSGAEYFAAVPKKVEKIVYLLSDMIPWVKLRGVQVIKNHNNMLLLKHKDFCLIIPIRVDAVHKF